MSDRDPVKEFIDASTSETLLEQSFFVEEMRKRLDAVDEFMRDARRHNFEGTKGKSASTTALFRGIDLGAAVVVQILRGVPVEQARLFAELDWKNQV